MAKFTCPKCDAKVEKESNEGPGCPCCGYCSGAEHTQLIPLIPPITYPDPCVDPPPWYPVVPWDGTAAPFPFKIYWTSDNTLNTSTGHVTTSKTTSSN